MSSLDPTTALLTKFAPVVYLHPKETSKPSSVDWYLQHVKLTDAPGTKVSDDDLGQMVKAG